MISLMWLLQIVDPMQWGGYGLAVIATAFYTKHRHGKHKAAQSTRATERNL